MRYIIHRFWAFILTIIGANILIFTITYFIPGDSARIILGPFATHKAVDLLKEDLGLYQPFFALYGKWVFSLLSGDWGVSYLYNQPILPLILNALFHSMIIAFLIFLFYIPVSVICALLSSLKPYGLWDRFISNFLLSLSSVPEFVTGTFLIFIFVVNFKIFPGRIILFQEGDILLSLKSMVLPVLTMSFVLNAYLYKILRAHLFENLKMPYIKTAKYLNLSRRQVIFSYLLPSLIKPLLTIAISQIGWILGGLIVIETLFQYPGLGSLIQSAAVNKDIPLLAGSAFMITTIFCFFSTVGQIISDNLSAEKNQMLHSGKVGKRK